MSSEVLERHQVWLCLAAIGVGAALGLAAPVVAAPAEAMITPVLALLLYVTFLGVPFRQLARSVRDVRFLATVFAVNFVAVPVPVWFVSRPNAVPRSLSGRRHTTSRPSRRCSARS